MKPSLRPPPGIAVFGSAVLLSLSAIFISSHSHAADRDWTAASSNDWFTPGNWTPSGTPSYSVDILYIANGGTSIIDRTGAGAYRLFIGKKNADSGALIITGSLRVYNEVVVGNNTRGSLTLTGSGALSASNLLIGGTYSAGTTAIAGTGTVLVTGTGAKINLSSALTVGNTADGVLTISDGGFINAGYNTTIGSYSHASGTATVSGDNARLNTSSLYVATNGRGVLDLLSGGRIIATDRVYLGSERPGTGIMRISGTDTLGNASLLTVTSYLTIGDSGTGTLTISDGGRATASYSHIGYGNSGTGALIVTGTGSVFSNTSSQYASFIGYNGAATMLVSAGGVVENNYASYIGYNNASRAAVTITGTGSQWNNSQSINAGYYGTGTLTLSDGGRASTTSLRIHNGSVVNIGAAQGDAAVAPGILDAPRIWQQIAGTGTLQFNHTATSDTPYYFTRNATATGGAISIENNITLLHNAGATVFTGTYSHTGGTIINGGVATFAQGSLLQFTPSSTPAVSGAGSVIFDGTFDFTPDAASLARASATWRIIAAPDATYGTHFDVTGFTRGSGQLSSLYADTTRRLVFDVSTGNLRLLLADALYWTGGNGTWDAGSTNWYDNVLHSTPAIAWLPARTAVFDIAGGGTVAVNGNQQITGLQFDTTGYTLEGTGALTVSSGSTATLNVVNAGDTATIKAGLRGANFIKAGDGALNISGGITTAGNFRLTLADSGTLALTNATTTTSGGAIFADGTDSVLIEGVQDTLLIASNTASVHGGAIRTQHGSITLNTTTVDLVIRNNHAGNVGGALTGNGDITIGGRTTRLLAITDNTSNLSAGAVYSATGSIRVTGQHVDIDISRNSIANPAGMGGGAFETAKGNIIIDADTTGVLNISRNISRYRGGAFNAAGSVTISGSHSGIIIVSNTSTYSPDNDAVGGAIYSGTASTSHIGISATTAGALVISNNYADLRGGALHAHGGNIQIEGDYKGGIIITSNTAASTSSIGGAFYARNDIILNALSNSAFTINGNFSGTDGGAFATAFGNISIGGPASDLIVSGNRAQRGSGGAFYARTGGITINPALSTGVLSISANSAAISGGAFYAAGDILIDATTDVAPFLIVSNTIAGTSTLAQGGALYSGSNITITGSYAQGITIANNIASTTNTANGEARGGALYAAGNITLNSTDTEIQIIGNTVSASAKAYGGALFAGGSTAPLSGQFINNAATATGTGNNVNARGGAAYITADSGVIAATFTSNRATAQGTGGSMEALGGGLYVDDHFGIFSGTAIGNSASAINTGTGYYANARADGGGLWIAGRITEMSGLVTSNTVTATTSSITTNSTRAQASASGAGIMSSTIELLSGTVSYNRATATSSGAGDASASGGGLFVNGLVDFTGLISSNTTSAIATGSASAYADGGGVYGGISTWGSDAVLSGDITGNTAEATTSHATAIARATGGAIATWDTGGRIITITGGDYKNNRAIATGANAIALGGAIATNNGTIVIDPTQRAVTFENNSVTVNGVTTANAFYIGRGDPSNNTAADATLVIRDSTATGHLITIADGIVTDLNNSKTFTLAHESGAFAWGGPNRLDSAGGSTIALTGGTTTLLDGFTLTQGSINTPAASTIAFNVTNGALLTIAASSTATLTDTTLAVTNGGILGGAGRINGTATIGAGGIIDTGRGALTLSALTLGNGATIRHDADANSGLGYTIDITGLLTLGSSGTFSLYGSNPAGTYDVLHYGTLAGNLSGYTATQGSLFDTGSIIQIRLGDTSTFRYWTGGAGTWNAADTNWFTNEAHTLPASGTTWLTDGLAIFNTGSGTVAVSGDQQVSGLQFDVTGYTLAGTGTLHGTSGTAFSINTKADVATTIATAIDATAATGLVKYGSGTLTLSGSADLGTTRTTIDDGVLILGTDSIIRTSGFVSGNANSTLLANGGTIQATAATAPGTGFFHNFNGDIVIGANGLTFDTEAFAVSTTTSFNAAGLFTKRGSGTLDFTGIQTANTFAGGIDLGEGTLRVSNLAQLGTTLDSLRFTSTTASTAANLSFADSVTIDGAGADTQRLAGNSAFITIDMEAGATLEWKNSVIDFSDGSAIYAYSDTGPTAINLAARDGDIRFTDNRGGYYGGALAVYSEYTGVPASATLTMATDSGNIIFSGNQATAEGGAFDVSASTAGYVNLSSNTGAIIFRDNKAIASRGGAFSTNIIAGPSQINLTAGDGGILFENNEAGRFGGAIYVKSWISSTTTLHAKTGDITFQGNRHGVGSIDQALEPTEANAIYIHREDDDALNTLNLVAEAGQIIAFYDPIKTNHESLRLVGSEPETIVPTSAVTIDINRNPATSAITSGTVLFDTHASKIDRAQTTVYGGTLILANGASYGSTDTIGSAFTLYNGASLLAATGNNIINAATIDIHGMIDLVDVGQTATTLTLNGDVILHGGATLRLNLGALNTNDQIITNSLSFADITSTDKITLDLLPLVSGSFTLIGSSITTDFAASNFHIVDTEGLTAQIKLGANLADIVLALSGGRDNTTLHWTGATGTNTWNGALANWTDNEATPITTFAPGDRVIISGSGSAPVTLDIHSAGVGVADITVSGSTDIVFTGGGIQTGTSLGFTSLADATGKLTKTGTATLTLANVTNTFTNGIDLDEGTLIGSTDTLRTGPDAPITLTTGASLVYDQLNTGTAMAVHTGQGDIIKRGNGSLTLAGANTTTGNFTHEAGAVHLGTTWNGDYTLASTAGALTHAADASIVGNFTANGATLAHDLASPALAIGGIATFTGTNTIDLNAWQNGTHTLYTANGGITGLTNISDLITVNGERHNARQTATLALDNNDTDLLLTLASGNNVTLTWTSASGTWNTTTANWTDSADPAVTQFLDGDAVIFGAGNTSIQVSGTARVASMMIASGTNAFTGASIVSTNTTTLSNPTQDLTIASGASASFANTLSFANGINIATNASLTLADSGSTTADTAITNHGTFIFDRATTYTQATTIAGDGALIKRGTGELIVSATQAYTGNTTIEVGTFTLAANSALAGSGTVTNRGTLRSVDASARINGPIINYGLLSLASGTYHNTVANSGTITAFRHALGNVTNTGLIVTAGNATFAQNLTGNNGTVRFRNLGERITIEGNLSGAQTFANVEVNLGTAQADTINVLGTASGTHTLRLSRVGTSGPADPENFALPIITIANGDASFASPDQIIDGMSIYGLARATPTQWNLAYVGQSQTADVILSTAAILGADWHYSLDSLHQRMGDLRVGTSQATGNIWVRTNAYRLNAGPELAGDTFRQNTYGITAGADHAFSRVDSAVTLYAGGILQMGHSKRDYDHLGDSETNDLGVGLYATAIHDAGWYADFVAKFNHYKNTLDARELDNRVTTADYNSRAIGLSLELGKRIKLGAPGSSMSRFWLEPSIQTAVAFLNSADYTTSSDIEVSLDSSTAWQTRAQFRAGATFSRWTPYIKIAETHSDTEGGALHAQGRAYTPDYDGWRFEAGAGVSYLINPRSQLYLDYEYDKARAYDRPWAINLGYRRVW